MLDEDDDKIPMIVSGDFNVNFASAESHRLVHFFQADLNLTMNNNPAIPTTRGGTTFDAVFSRYLDRLKSTVYISYFSYHKPIVSYLENEPMEITEEL